MNSKKLNLILSFVLACALWLYVVGQMNPVTRKTYRDIPIMLTNEQTLSDNGLAVKSVSEDSLRVTLSGRRDVIGKLSKSDITATVDLTYVAEGRNKLQIDLKIPDNVEVLNQSLNDINVNIEERVTKTKDVHVVYTGTLPEEGEPATIKTDPETVKVSGARSIVEKVAYVKAEINASEISDELTSVSSGLAAVTEGGNAVNGVTLSDTVCKVTSIIYNTKEVRLKVPVTDNSKDGYTRSTSYPKTVTVKGPSGLLGGLEEVSAKEVDITGVTDNKQLPLTLDLPDGIQAAEKTGDLRMTVRVSKAKKKVKTAKEVKSFTYTGDDVEIRNAGEKDLRVKQDSIEVQIYGTEEQLSEIRSSDIKLYVDLSEVDEDASDLVVKAECGKDCADIAVIPSRVTVVS